MGDLTGELQGSPQPKIEVQPDGTYVVDGALPIDDVELDGLRHGELEGAGTVGGFVIAALGRLASPGDVVTAGKWEAVVEDVRARRVHRVRFRKRPEAGEEDADASG